MKKKLIILSALALFAFALTRSIDVQAASKEALKLCAELIIPSLFPFFVLSLLLNRLGLPAVLSTVLSPIAAKLFHVSGAGASALIIGLTGGYPLGAAYIADMLNTGVIDKREGEWLLAFCNNSGPAFIMGAVGCGVFSSSRIGVFLYIVHAFAAIITGVIIRFIVHDSTYSTKGEKHHTLPSVSFGEALTDSVRSTVTAILNVCGFVVVFSVLVGILDSNGTFSLAVGQIASHTAWELKSTRALLTGLIELGSGIGTMRGLNLSRGTLSLAAFLVGWGGISVHFQTASVLVGSGTKGVLHFAGRLMSAFIGGIIAYVFYPVIF